MKTIIHQLRLDRRGVAAIEYALIASLIAVAAVAGMTVLGDSQEEQWNEVNDNLDAA